MSVSSALDEREKGVFLHSCPVHLLLLNFRVMPRSPVPNFPRSTYGVRPSVRFKARSFPLAQFRKC